MLLPSTGAVVEYAGHLIGSRRFTDDVVKVKMLCGVQSSDC